MAGAWKLAARIVCRAKTIVNCELQVVLPREVLLQMMVPLDVFLC